MKAKIYGKLSIQLLASSIYKIWLGAMIIVGFLSPSMSAQSLSPSAKISVLTCDPGDQIHSIFGHTSVWVSDPIKGIDEVYNYGMFDYEESNFLLNFLKGKMHYSLGRSNIDRFLYTYNYYQRGVRSQELNLDSLNKENYYQFLRTNYLPENRKYWYDYFFDNCSSRVGVSLEAEVAGYMYPDTTMDRKSFREYLDEYIVDQLPWTDFGIDLIQGQPADRPATFREAMFLPDYLESHLDHAVFTSMGEVLPIVKSKQELLSIERNTNAPWFTPLILFCILLFIEVALLFFRSADSTLVRVYDMLWLVIAAIVSLIMMGMWFLTEHIACGQNWNLLWASPLYIPLLIFWNKVGIRNLLIKLIMVSTSLVLIGWWFIPQTFHVAIVPICLILLIKLYRKITGSMS